MVPKTESLVRIKMGDVEGVKKVELQDKRSQEVSVAGLVRSEKVCGWTAGLGSGFVRIRSCPNMSDLALSSRGNLLNLAGIFCKALFSWFGFRF